MNEQQFMTQLSIDLVEVGMNNNMRIRAMNVPGQIWLNWEDGESDMSGTAQIDSGVVTEGHGSPHECAEKFVDYIVDACDSYSEAY